MSSVSTVGYASQISEGAEGRKRQLLDDRFDDTPGSELPVKGRRDFPADGLRGIGSTPNGQPAFGVEKVEALDRICLVKISHE